MEQLIFDAILKKIQQEPKPQPRPKTDIKQIVDLAANAAINKGLIWEHGELEAAAMDAIFNCPGALLMGKKGTGKTLCLELAAKIWGYYRGKYGFISTEKLSLKYSQIGSEAILNLDRIPLFLDDLGIEEPSYNSYGNKIDAISTLLLMRYENKAPTFCTTNLNIEQLTERYGDRLSDRFKQMFKIVLFTGESKRK